MNACVFCERSALRSADIYIENAHCVYSSSHDPHDPPDVLPWSGIIVPKAHRSSPFDLTPDEWLAIRELLLQAKQTQDARLAPDGYFLSWTSFPGSEEEVPTMHTHLHWFHGLMTSLCASAAVELESRVQTTSGPTPRVREAGERRGLGWLRLQTDPLPDRAFD